MASILGKIVADFSTSLATKVAVGGNSATLQSATDDDGVALPAGKYFLTVDGNSSQKEYWVCDLLATALTNIKSISRQGTQVANSAREHRIGASVKITNFAHIKYINDLLNGDATFDADLVFTSNDLTGVNSIAGLATPGAGELTKAASVDYVNGVALAGAPDAADAVKGVVEIATQAEIDAGDDTGSTTAPVVVTPSRLANVVQDASYVYAADAEASDTYVITLTPAIAAYVAGQSFYFKANTANTGACTLNVNAKGAKNILKYNDQALETGDIEAGQIVHVIYDGTSMQLQTPSAATMTTALQTEAGTFFGATDITGAEAETLTAGVASNANALHFHPTFFEQDISVVGSSTAGYASTLKFSTNSSGTIGVSLSFAGAALEIRRYALEQNQYVITHSTTLASAIINESSAMILSNYIYVEVEDNGTRRIKRYDLADLANVTTITISGTQWNGGGSSFTDGTNLFIFDSPDTFFKYTISGTTATYDSSITYTAAGAMNDNGATSDGVSVWTTASTSGSITIKKFAIAGGAATGSAVKIFTMGYPNVGRPQLFTPNTSALGFAFGHTIESNSAVISSALKLSAITRF